MRIAVAREVEAAEPRVAATPETVKKMIGLGAEVAVEPGAGIKSGILDADYAAAGATVGKEAVAGADVVLKVRRRPPPSSPPTRKARSSSPSWIRMATRRRCRQWPRPASSPLPWS
jgi:NAD/NADP transhydrogenase alpha subunit